MKVQEALKNALFTIRCYRTEITLDKKRPNDLIEVDLVISEIEAALADIEKCEPVLFAVKDYELCAKHFNGQTLCSLEKTDLHEIPLFTVQQRQHPLKRLSEKQILDIYHLKLMFDKPIDYANTIMDSMQEMNK